MYSNRISHFFDLRGPSVTADTGCSGSMAALHLGAQTIRSGESDMSIIAVAQLMQNPDLVIALSNLGVLGPEGRCYSWDHRANGYGRGEGMAVVVLKRLSNALTDGDNVHAVIRETHMNQDGKTSTITSPSMDAQQRLIKECYERAGLQLSDTAYVEAHMTGTPTGDPIEAEVLSKTFGSARSADNPVYVGSIKPNIGHTEPVSGLASIIKTALVLKKGLIPPHINYEKPNPAILLDEWNLKLPLELTPWPKSRPIRASVNNFGYGGTNVHVIMESLSETLASKTIAISSGFHSNGIKINGVESKVNATIKDVGSHEQHQGQLSSHVYIVSAKHSAGTVGMNKSLAAYLRDYMAQDREINPVDLAHTLSDRRSRFQWATCVRATSLEDLAKRLEDPQRKPIRAPAGRLPRIGFVFNGQGAQWAGMGRELLDAYPLFKESMCEADRILRDKYAAPWSLYEELFQCDNKTTRIDDAEISQPASVAVQLCLVDLLRSWNITPSAVVSHSSGEIPAAYAAGLLTFEEALGVVYYRGQLANKLINGTSSDLEGGMMAARLSAEEAEEYIKDLSSDGKVVIACVNSPNSVTLSGDIEALEEVAERLEDDAVTARKLKVPLAYHSHHMKKMADDYEAALSTIIPGNTERRELQTLFASAVTGDIITSSEAIMNPRHWVENLTKPVLFSQALEKMVFSSDDANKATSAGAKSRAANVDIILEIGAHSTLSGAIRETLGSANLPYTTCLKRLTNAVTTMQDMAAELATRGCPVALRQVNRTMNCTYVLHDLPSYSWDHNTRFIVEPRASRENRYRRFATHELLGSPVPGSNALTPTWRNFLRLQDIPWLEDHQLDGRTVLPGAAYITLAIEAVRKLKQAKKEEPVGYRIRDVVIMNALLIPTDSRGAEIIFTLRECDSKELDHRDWFEFELCSVGADDSWIRHCTGFAMAETMASTKKQAVLNKKAKSAPTVAAFITCSAGEGESQIHDVDPMSTFADMRKMGIYHGPSFQNLIGSKVSSTHEKSVTDFAMAPCAIEQQDEYVMHPTTLDSIFQTCYFSLPPDAREGGMPVPRSIGTMYVPGKLGRHDSHKLRSYVELLKTNRRGATFNGNVFPDADVNEEEPGSAPFQMRDMRLQRIQAEDDEYSSKKTSRIHSQTRWEMDVMHELPTSVLDSLQIILSDAELTYEKSMIEGAYYLLSNALEELEKNGSADSQVGKPYLHKYLAWIQDSVTSVEQNTIPHASALGSSAWPGTSPQARAALLQNLETGGGAGGEMLCRIGRKIPAIIRGELHPLELMTEGGLLQRYYAEVPQFENCYRQLRRVMELYAVKQPGARILEIGAGTGGATVHVLEGFAAHGDNQNDGSPSTLLGHYDYTDISADFFIAAREKFATWKDKMSFIKMDIENDPIEQGLAAGSYDLIVASQVLHATKSLDNTLANVRKLLRPGGRLVMLEGTKHGIGFEIIWGSLPGWWLSEDPERQKKGALADEETWQRYLTTNGFSGIDINVLNCKQEQVQISNVIVSTAVGPEPPSYPSNISIIHNSENKSTWAWLEELATALTSMSGGKKPILETVEGVEPKADTIYVVTNELTQPLVGTMTEPVFEKVRRILVDGQGVFWLSRGGYIDSSRPLWNETQGLLRTFRREDQSKKCVSLDFDADPWALGGDSFMKHILRVFIESFDYNKGTTNPDMDWEYAVKDAVLHVPRIFPDVALDHTCSGGKPIPEPQPWHATGERPRDLVYQIPQSTTGGLPDKFTFAEVPAMVDSDQVPAGMVEIETRAFGLNFRDLMLAMGLVDDFVFPTHEAAGIVTRLGPETAEKSGIKVGDRVCGAFRGDFSSTSRGWWENITKIPEGMSFEEGAAFPIAYLTAHVGLFHVARLESGERVLIHSAAGGVGQAAIMLAQQAGAEVFVTCGTEAKRTFLMERYGIPADHIFSSRNASFADEIKARTDEEGVDVVLNSLAGPLLKSTWECMAQFGRFVEIGKVDLHASRKLDMTPLGHNVTMSGLDLVQYSEHGARGRNVIQRALADLVKLYNLGKIKSVHPVNAYSVSEMGEAFKFMQTGTHMGKLVISTGKPDDVVNVIPQVPSIDLGLMDNITHLIVGGLKGVAYALALRMIEEGARNVVAISRNAVNHPNAAALTKKAQEHGCNLVIRDCDITDEKAFLGVLAELKVMGMPRVGGVLQAAMVLDVSFQMVIGRGQT